jgi:hypothetical protein
MRAEQPTSQTSPTLSYAPPAPRFHLNFRQIIFWLAVVAPIAFVLLFPFVDFRSQTFRTCRTCGSLEFQMSYLDTFHCTPTVNSSHLEQWLIQHEGSHVHSWQFMSRSSGRLRECGSAPPSYTYRSIDEEFIQAATDAQIAEFVETLRNGSDEQQEHALRRACDIALSPHTTQSLPPSTNSSTAPRAPAESSPSAADAAPKGSR